jgi:hypothetical protein
MNKNLKLTIAIAFLAGYFVSDVINDVGISFVSEAKADINGMDYYDLKSDYDFVKAVKYVVTENCHTHVNKNNHSTDHHCD